jgi:hypothetical protein
MHWQVAIAVIFFSVFTFSEVVGIAFCISIFGMIIGGTVITIESPDPMTNLTVTVGVLHALACGSLARREKGDPHYSVLLGFVGGSLCLGIGSSLWPACLLWVPCLIVGACLTPPIVEHNNYLESQHCVTPQRASWLRKIFAGTLVCYGLSTAACSLELFPEDWWSTQGGFMIWLPLLSSMILAICWTRWTEAYKHT